MKFMDKHGHAVELLADEKARELAGKLPVANAKEKAIAREAKQRGTRNREMRS